jgi:hypothetical protein
MRAWRIAARARAADRRGRQTEARRDHRPRRADRGRATSREARRGRHHQSRDRPSFAHHDQDRQGSPRPRLPQARDHPSRPARRRAHRPSWLRWRGPGQHRGDHFLNLARQKMVPRADAPRTRPVETAAMQITTPKRRLVLGAAIRSLGHPRHARRAQCRAPRRSRLARAQYRTRGDERSTRRRIVAVAAD